MDWNVFLSVWCGIFLITGSSEHFDLQTICFASWIIVILLLIFSVTQQTDETKQCKAVSSFTKGCCFSSPLPSGSFSGVCTATRQTHYVLLRIYVGKLQQLLQFLGVTVYGFCPQWPCLLQSLVAPLLIPASSTPHSLPISALAEAGWLAPLSIPSVSMPAKKLLAS